METRREILNELALEQARLDAIHRGTGFARVKADGSIERIDPQTVFIEPFGCKVCGAPAGVACTKPECPQGWLIQPNQRF